MLKWVFAVVLVLAMISVAGCCCCSNTNNVSPSDVPGDDVLTVNQHTTPYDQLNGSTTVQNVGP